MNSEIQWKDEYCLGNDLIDSEHKKLFEIASQIFAIKNPQANSDKIKKLIHELYDYMRCHFKHEEEHMAEVLFEEIDQHKNPPGPRALHSRHH